MAANLINQLSTANTFQNWLQATESLISTVNLVTNGNGDNFYANTHLYVGGSDSSLNVVTGASINVTTGNTVNTINLESRSTVFSGNVTSKATLTMDTGAGLFIGGETVINLTMPHWPMPLQLVSFMVGIHLQNYLILFK